MIVLFDSCTEIDGSPSEKEFSQINSTNLSYFTNTDSPRDLLESSNISESDFNQPKDSHSNRSEISTSTSLDEAQPSKHPWLIQVMLEFEFIWRAVFLVICLIGFILIRWIYRFHTDPITANISKGAISDFWLSCAFACLIALIRSRSREYLYPYMVAILANRKKLTSELCEKQANNLCKWVVDIVYYFMSSLMGVLVLKDTPYLPTCLLGNGVCSNILRDYPTIIEVEYLRTYFMIQGGTHLYSLVEQMLFRREEKKFYEYALHHSVTLFLITFSYLMNLIMIGSIVLIIHDISDTALLITRFYRCLQKKVPQIEVTIGGISLLIWMYTRNILLPFCVIKTSLGEVYRFQGTAFHDIIFPPGLFMIAMLGILAVLHVYWTIFFLYGVIDSAIKQKSSRIKEE